MSSRLQTTFPIVKRVGILALTKLLTVLFNAIPKTYSLIKMSVIIDYNSTWLVHQIYFFHIRWVFSLTLLLPCLLIIFLTTFPLLDTVVIITLTISLPEFSHIIFRHIFVKHVRIYSLDLHYHVCLLSFLRFSIV